MYTHYLTVGPVAPGDPSSPGVPSSPWQQEQRKAQQ